ncbi:MAG TPA: prepilin peptidase [Candidatus Saccharimonadales bacterium]
MIWVILAVLGLCAGSFISAVVWRVRQKSLKSGHPNLSIFSGRSQCPNCHHVLAWYDLIPLFSWLLLRGRCRYCRRHISWQYPAIELAAAAIFVVSYAYWPDGVYGAADWVLLLTWLLTSVGLLALLIYDLKWMMLPNKIIYPTLVVAIGGRSVYLISFETDIKKALIDWSLSVLLASGLFWLIFMASSGKWIGYGDVRLGLITGTVLADPLLSILMIFVASVLGTLIALPALATGRKRLNSKLPFGPFLITATALVLLFGQIPINWYKQLLE